MKQEYDFTNAEQGRFYCPKEDLDIPVYLDSDVRNFLIEKIKAKSLSEAVNTLLRQDIEINKCLN